MLVPVMLVGTGCESAPGELQRASSHFPKIRLFTQPLLRTCVRFDKASEQIHSVLYAFGHSDRRKIARLFHRHARLTDIPPNMLRIQMFDLKPVNGDATVSRELSNNIDTMVRLSSSRYLPTVFLCGSKVQEKKKLISCRFLTSWMSCI